jgi:hypothetical protein
VRSRIPTRLVALVLVFILLPSVPSLALAQAQVPSVPAAQGPAPVDLAWPRQMETGGNVILIYQPQPVKWEGNRLEARAAEGFSLHAYVKEWSQVDDAFEFWAERLRKRLAELRKTSPAGR